MKKIIDWQKIKEIHFTGIKGVGMTALALCAQDLGIKITGSDIKEYFVTDKILKEARIKWKEGFSISHLGKPDLLIFTAAHDGENNIEVIGAKKRNIPVLSHAQALGMMMRGKIGISVCGVGGKTTTAAMVATIFQSAGLNPSFAIGAGELYPLKRPGKYNQKGEYFIAEADEYFASPQNPQPRFLYQNPKFIILTNLEYDHPDVYSNLSQTIKSFKEFIEKLPKKGKLITCIDNKNIRQLVQLIKVPVETYGFSPQADWQINLINQTNGKTKFSLKHNQKIIDNIILSVSGKFNVNNAAAAFIAAKLSSVKTESIKKGLLLFKGSKRRFELIKKINSVMLFDDYAHHPSEIRATLRAAKEKFDNKRIIAIFQPHTYSRTKALFSDFAKSFSMANLVIFVPIYASAREVSNLGMSSLKLANETKKFHQHVIFAPNKKLLIKELGKNIKANDIIFTLGAGDIFHWHQTIIKFLENKKYDKN